MTNTYFETVYALGRLIAGRGDGPPDWREPNLLRWSGLIATSIWPALEEETRTRFVADLEGFAVAHALNTDRNAEILVQLERVVARLNDIGIVPIVMKGAGHIATDLWPTPGSRLTADIDLLVQTQEMQPAFTALEELAGDGPQERGHPEINALHKHMSPVIGAGGQAAVELHHSIYAGRTARLAPVGLLRERARPLRLGDTQALILSPTDRVLTAMMHGPAGNRTWLVPTLQTRDMLDIHFLDAAHGNDIDWDWIRHHLTAEGWAVALEITNACLERFTGMAPPFPRSGAFVRLDGARWVRQMERGDGLLRRAGMAANHLDFTIASLKAGGEPRRRILAKLTRGETYRMILRHYVLGGEKDPSEHG